MSWFKKNKTILKDTLQEHNQKKEEQFIKEETYKQKLEKKIFRGFKNLKIFFSFSWINNETDFSKLQIQIEEMFLHYDFGASLSLKLSENIISEIKYHNSKTSEQIKNIIKQELLKIYSENTNLNTHSININKNKINILLICGANGVGKTTTIAKIAHYYKKQQYKILLVAGDTFRAGATEQLNNWSKKIGVDIALPDKEDPATLIFKSLSNNEKHNLIICDTSGKQHNNKNLMKEMEKIFKVIKKFDEYAPQECLLVLDSTIGQYSFLQTESFLEMMPISGIILTKLDTLTRGGIIFAIKNKYNIPVKFIGVGEHEEDFGIFDAQQIIVKFVDLMFETETKN